MVDTLPCLLNNESRHYIELSKVFYEAFYGRNLNSTNYSFNILIEYQRQGLRYIKVDVENNLQLARDGQ